MVEEFHRSERRVCGLMEILRMSYRYQSRRDDTALRERLLALAREKPRYGYRRLWALSGRVRKANEERMNQKRVWRVYRDLGLSVRRTRRKHHLAWCIERRIDAVHIQPGKPTQNAHVESFHGWLRDECLNVSWFWNLFDARNKIAAWRVEYNSQRPHLALRYLTPEEFARKAASPSAGSDTTRPFLPQGFPDGSAVAVAPAPASTQSRVLPSEKV